MQLFLGFYEWLFFRAHLSNRFGTTIKQRKASKDKKHLEIDTPICSTEWVFRKNLKDSKKTLTS